MKEGRYRLPATLPRMMIVHLTPNQNLALLYHEGGAKSEKSESVLREIREIKQTNEKKFEKILVRGIDSNGDFYDNH